MGALITFLLVIMAIVIVIGVLKALVVGVFETGAELFKNPFGCLVFIIIVLGVILALV